MGGNGMPPQQHPVRGVEIGLLQRLNLSSGAAQHTRHSARFQT